MIINDNNRDIVRYILLEFVDKEWNVRKDASRLCNVGPTGILYIGYLEPGFNSLKRQRPVTLGTRQLSHHTDMLYSNKAEQVNIPSHRKPTCRQKITALVQPQLWKLRCKI